MAGAISRSKLAGKDLVPSGVYMRMCVYACVCVCAYVCVCICVCMYACVYVYVYTHLTPSELREALWEASKGGPPRYLVKYTPRR